MNEASRVTLLLSSALSLLGCGAPTAVGYGPGVTAAERDQAHRTTPRPSIASMDALTATTVTAVFDVPLSHIRPWFRDLALEDALPGTDAIPGVKGTVMLSDGPWGEAESRRRVLLDDDSAALEEIVVNELPRRVRYVVWNYTSDAAAYVRYGVGEFRFRAQGAQTEVSWTYAFEANGWPASWFLGGFVRGDYRDMMLVSIDQMKHLAEHSYRERAARASR